MSKSFQRLASVLKLEAQQGYKNKAVVGGIRQFITFWVGRAREEATNEVDRAFIEQTADALSGYGALSGNSARAALVDRLLEHLESRIPTTPPLSKQPDPAPKPSRPDPQKPPPPPDAPPEPTHQKPYSPLDSGRRSNRELGKSKQNKRNQQSRRKSEHENYSISEAPTPIDDTPVAADVAGLNQSTQAIKGIGPRIAELLSKLSVDTIEDLLHFYPRRYDDYTLMKPINRLKFGESVTIIGTVWDVRARRTRNNAVVVQATISDGSGKIEASWYNQQWLIQKLKTGHRIVITGRVEQYLGRLVLNSPDWELLSMDALRTGQIVPIYPLTKGLSNHKLRQLMKSNVPYWSKRIPDPLPKSTRTNQSLPSLTAALRQIHLPDSQDDLIRARRRLMFDEMFFLQLGMLGQRRDWQKSPGRALRSDGQMLRTFIGNLPFKMTGAQERVIREIIEDMRTDEPMNRMLQGDVGAGKTLVAASAMISAVAAGTQAAIMAPTEILAEQHYSGLSQLLEPLGVQVALLTGSVTAGARRDALESIASGQAQVVVGTHAIIQESVEFANLGAAVIDEQHRFGVDQRAALRHKGPLGESGEQLTPHLLVMSATPIPRSLALSLFGDLDLSVLDEMPPGRQQIDTRWIRPRERERCYAFVRGQVEKGRQAYIICPLVEESDKIEAVAAVEEHARLQNEVFPDLRLGLVHGKLSSADKESVMRQFYDGDLDVLVSTSVIEVGVDVPNSTVMVIEGANRFGLAQLHQFRGRVGRGSHQSYCLLIADETTPEAEDRLTALEQTNDGFQLAEKDLELRGPGEFFGRRQSGLPELRMASLTDMSLLEAARTEAEAILAEDPDLERPEHQVVQARVKRFWENAADMS